MNRLIKVVSFLAVLAIGLSFLDLGGNRVTLAIVSGSENEALEPLIQD